MNHIMNIIWGIVWAQVFWFVYSVIADVVYIYKNRSYNGTRLMLLLTMLIPFAPALVGIRIGIEKLERIILPKRWYFMPKMKKL